MHFVQNTSLLKFKRKVEEYSGGEKEQITELLKKRYRVNHNTNSYFPDYRLYPFNISKHSSKEIHFLPKKKIYLNAVYKAG